MAAPGGRPAPAPPPSLTPGRTPLSQSPSPSEGPAPARSMLPRLPLPPPLNCDRRSTTPPPATHGLAAGSDSRWTRFNSVVKRRTPTTRRAAISHCQMLNQALATVASRRGPARDTCRALLRRRACLATAWPGSPSRVCRERPPPPPLPRGSRGAPAAGLEPLRTASHRTVTLQPVPPGWSPLPRGRLGGSAQSILLSPSG